MLGAEAGGEEDAAGEVFGDGRVQGVHACLGKGADGCGGVEALFFVQLVEVEDFFRIAADVCADDELQVLAAGGGKEHGGLVLLVEFGLLSCGGAL